MHNIIAIAVRIHCTICIFATNYFDLRINAFQYVIGDWDKIFFEPSQATYQGKGESKNTFIRSPSKKRIKSTDII